METSGRTAVVASLLRRGRHKDGRLAACAVLAVRGLTRRIAHGAVGAAYVARRDRRRMVGSRSGCVAPLVPSPAVTAKGVARVAAVPLGRTVVGLTEEATSGTTGIEDASFSGEAAITIASSQRSSCTTTWCGFPSLGLRAAPRDERDVEHWKELGMTHLVTLCKVPGDAPRFATSRGIHHIVVPLGSLVQTRGPKAEIRNHDWAKLTVVIATVSDLLEAGASVVVHCFKGLHRTGVVGYNVLRLGGLEPGDVLREMESARPLCVQELKARTGARPAGSVEGRVDHLVLPHGPGAAVLQRSGSQHPCRLEPKRAGARLHPSPGWCERLGLGVP